MSTTEQEGEDEFYDSETEPSFIEQPEKAEPKEQTPLKEPPIQPQVKILPASPQTQKSNLNSSISLTPNRSYKPIYAVQFVNKPKPTISSDGSKPDLVSTNRIFINADTAKKLCKQDPDNRRFKVCKNFNEAYAFSYEVELESGQAPSMEQVKASLSLANNSLFSPSTESSSNLNNSISSPVSTPNQPTKSTNLSQDAEKLPFSAPRKPEVNELRIFVERDDFQKFSEKVLANPRFLISAGDAPVVVQEAFRYNLLHTCAKEKRAKICEFILGLLSSSKYIQKLYRNDTAEQSKARSMRILDLYLNTPEKGVE